MRDSDEGIDYIYKRGLLRCYPTIDGQCEKPQSVGWQPIQIPTLFLYTLYNGRQRGDDCGTIIYIMYTRSKFQSTEIRLEENVDNHFSNPATGEKTRRCTCSLYMTERCNLKCIYCYEHIKRDTLLSLEIALIAIKETFERAVAEKVGFVEILFHGGEPFMAFERIKEICGWLWSQDWPCKYICFATTNGTLVHGEIKDWLTNNSHKFVAGLSLDGTREMHNRNRSNSYDKIDIPFFSKTWPTQGVKMTPSPGTIHTLANGVIHLHELGFTKNNCSFASGIDCTHDDTGKEIDYKTILLEQFGKLAEYYLAHPDIMPVDMLNIRFVAIAAGIENMKSKLCGAGSIMRCWTPDGKCLPCHLFYEAYKNSPDKELPNFNFENSKNLSDPGCLGCILEPACPTCYGGNFVTNGDIRIRDRFTCEIMKLRSLVSSWMVGKMLESPERYAALKTLSSERLAMTAKGVIMVQKYIHTLPVS